jgi:tetratricopeptide (TPR) repeat protein
MDKENIISLIAIWDEEFGPKIMDICPTDDRFDFRTIVNNIFITYHNFYKKDLNTPAQKFIFKLPPVNINKKAKIFVDKVLDEEKVLIVVLFIPDYFPDESMIIFDNIIENIGMEYNELKTKVLDKYIDQINEKFILEQTVKDAGITINDDYLIKDALQDFRTGLEQYKKKELDRSYYLLQKAHLKFELDDQLQFLLETSYFIGTILMQKNKFIAAKEYFKKLGNLAVELQHEKYIERAIFMEGYCDYQENNYQSAYENFIKLNDSDLKFVSKFRYNTLMGKVLADIGHYDDSIEVLEKALELNELMQDSVATKKKRAEIFLDLGHISYEMVYQAKKSGKLKENISLSHLSNSINYFKETIKIWEKIDNYPGLIELYQLLASMHEILGESEFTIEYYEKALEYAEISNDLVNRFKILETVIQIYAQQNLHAIIIKKIDIILFKIAPVAYLDLSTVASFHRQLGESLIALNRNNDALSELIVALNLYGKLSKPVPDLLIVLKRIIEIYKQKDDPDRVEYYEDRKKRAKDELDEIAIQEKIELKSLEVVEEFWIFTNEGGVAFSYTPKTDVNPKLLSGFLMAMDHFGTELKMDQIKTLRIGNENFVYYKEKEQPIFIVGRSKITFQIDYIEEIIQKIYLKFIKLYEPFLEEFDEDSSKFDSFIDVLKKLE